MAVGSESESIGQYLACIRALSYAGSRDADFCCLFFIFAGSLDCGAYDSPLSDRDTKDFGGFL